MHTRNPPKKNKQTKKQQKTTTNKQKQTNKQTSKQTTQKRMLTKVKLVNDVQELKGSILHQNTATIH